MHPLPEYSAIYLRNDVVADDRTIPAWTRGVIVEYSVPGWYLVELFGKYQCVIDVAHDDAIPASPKR